MNAAIKKRARAAASASATLAKSASGAAVDSASTLRRAATSTAGKASATASAMLPTMSKETTSQSEPDGEEAREERSRLELWRASRTAEGGDPADPSPPAPMATPAPTPASKRDHALPEAAAEADGASPAPKGADGHAPYAALELEAEGDDNAATAAAAEAAAAAVGQLEMQVAQLRKTAEDERAAAQRELAAQREKAEAEWVAHTAALEAVRKSANELETDRNAAQLQVELLTTQLTELHIHLDRAEAGHAACETERDAASATMLEASREMARMKEQTEKDRMEVCVQKLWSDTVPRRHHTQPRTALPAHQPPHVKSLHTSQSNHLKKLLASMKKELSSNRKIEVRAEAEVSVVKA